MNTSQTLTPFPNLYSENADNFTVRGKSINKQQPAAQATASYSIYIMSSEHIPYSHGLAIFLSLFYR